MVSVGYIQKAEKENVRAWVRNEKRISKVDYIEVPPHETGFVIAHSVNEEDNTATVFFPQGRVEVALDSLIGVDAYKIEESIDHLQDFIGHHSAQPTDFQFDIKIHSVPDVLPRVMELLTDDEIRNAYGEIFEHELRCSFDKRYTDFSPMADWQVFHDYHTAGRLGGWLILQTDIDYGIKQIELEEIEAEEKEAEENYQDGEIDSQERSSILYDTMLRKEEIRNELDNLSRTVQLVKAYIDNCKIGLFNYLKTPECWERFLEDKEEENNQLEEARVAWQTLETLASTDKDIHRCLELIKPYTKL